MTLRRPKNPGARRHLERTDAQERAFRVFRLRGLYWMAFALTGDRRKAALDLIDAEIADLGAETESARHQRRMHDLDARLDADEREHAILEEELPL